MLCAKNEKTDGSTLLGRRERVEIPVRGRTRAASFISHLLVRPSPLFTEARSKQKRKTITTPLPSLSFAPKQDVPIDL
jgi:hypothetical protein